MLLTEQIECVDRSQTTGRAISIEKGNDDALLAACARWRRSARHFDRALLAVAQRDKITLLNNAVKLANKVEDSSRRISQTAAISFNGLAAKVSICIESLRPHNLEAESHFDNFILSCLDDAERILVAHSTAIDVSPVREVSAACRVTLKHLTDALLILQHSEVSDAQERAYIIKLRADDERLRGEVLRLTQLKAASLQCMFAKSSVLRGLIDAGHWEFSSRRDLALSFFEDLSALTVFLPRGPSLLSRSTRFFKSLAWK